MRNLLRWIAVVGLATAGVCGHAQVRSAVLLPTQAARDVPRLDRTQIPGYSAAMHVERRQSFRLSGEGFVAFDVVPVLFDSTSAENKIAAPRCGVFLVPAEGAATFVATVGYGWLEVETCSSLEGVGFVPVAGGRPRILLLYKASSPNETAQEPVVVDWDPAAKRYVASEAMSRQMPSPATIPLMKSKLKAMAGQ